MQQTELNLQNPQPKIEPFEFQNWEVYKKSILWVSKSGEILQKIAHISRSLKDQLDRASHSIPLNIAEGSSRYSVKDKTNFLRIARGSVFECVSIIDVLHVKGALTLEDVKNDTTLLSDIGRMLSALMNWLYQNEKK